METTTEKFMECADIDSKELNTFLSQVGKNDPVHIRILDGTVMLLADNLKKNFTIIQGHDWSDTKAILDLSVSKETLQRFTKISPILYLEMSQDKESGKCELSIDGSAVSVSEGTTFIPDEATAWNVEQNHELDVKLIEKLLTHCSQEDNRYVYNGVCLEISGNQIVNMISTDGRRMAVNELPVVESLEVNQFIIHHGALKSAVAIAKKKKTSTIIWNSVSNAMTIDDIIIESRPIEGRFPDWKKVVPGETNFNVSARRYDLLAVLKQCKETTEKPSHQVKISVIDYSTLKFSTEIVDVMKKDYELKAEHNLENDFEVAFNAVYLLDAIKMLEHETVNLKFVDSNRPLLIEEENKTILIMPMRI